MLEVDKTLHDERLEQLERHQLGQTALVQLQCRTNHDHRTAGVVDALAQQVLAEATLLALEHVGQRLQRTVTRTGHRTAATTVVEQCVDGFLQHALLVVDDDLGRTEIEQTLQAVVAVDHTAVEVVEVDVAKRPPSSCTIGRSSGGITGNRVEHHAPGSLPSRSTTVERGNNLEALERLLFALCRR